MSGPQYAERPTVTPQDNGCVMVILPAWAGRAEQKFWVLPEAGTAQDLADNLCRALSRASLHGWQVGTYAPS